MDKNEVEQKESDLLKVRTRTKILEDFRLNIEDEPDSHSRILSQRRLAFESSI